MKKIIVVLLLAASGLMLRSDSGKVYVCDSDQAVAFHQQKSCRGLQKCTHQILYMPVDSARLRGLRACKLCY